MPKFEKRYGITTLTLNKQSRGFWVFPPSEYLADLQEKYAGSKKVKKENLKTGESNAKQQATKGKTSQSFSQILFLCFSDSPEDDLTLAVSREAQRPVEPLEDLKVVVCSPNFSDLVIWGYEMYSA